MAAGITVATHARVRTITVHRPDKLNALDRATLLALDEAFAAAGDDEQVRAVVLTGAGAKAFVAGADIAEMAALEALDGRGLAELGQRLMRRIERLPKPVIAAINGYALGGGLELALACHLRIAADTAKLGQPEIKLGLIPGFGGTQRLLRLCGRAAALELCLLGEPVDAARAQQWGLLNRVVPADQLAGTAQQLAETLAGAAPLALRAVLDAVVVGGECGLEEGLALEAALFGLAFASEDRREGTRAFLEGRAPRFAGR